MKYAGANLGVAEEPIAGPQAAQGTGPAIPDTCKQNLLDKCSEQFWTRDSLHRGDTKRITLSVQHVLVHGQRIPEIDSDDLLETLTLQTGARNLSRMDSSNQANVGQSNVWQRWVHQPQKMWLRKALFQVHLWSGIGIGLYVLMISVTGSVLVYSNELFVAATPKPIVSTASGPRLNDEQLTEAALRIYPGYQVDNLERPRNPDQAVDIRLRRGANEKVRLFDPRTGNDLGDAVPLGIRLVSEIRDLHDNLLGGETGRMVNGVGALAVFALAATGLVIWWPGIKTWRRSLILHRGVGWKRLIWDLHGMIGFWSLGFILIFVVSGFYLSIPQPFENLVDRLEPIIGDGDRVIYWLAILHFGRIKGIGFPCSGPGLCDQTTKAIWSVFGLAPAAMFATGAIMWWNRVLRPRWQSIAGRTHPDAEAEAATALLP